MENNKQVEKDLLRIQDTALRKAQSIKEDTPKTHNLGNLRIWHKYPKELLMERLKGVARLNGEAERHLKEVESEDFFGKGAISNETKEKFLHNKINIAIASEEALDAIEREPPTKPEKAFKAASKVFQLPIPSALKGFLQGGK